ncbi:MAG: 5'-methylthioadenosine/S-adenosylhomocysteine nucleosidase [Anaerolineae bacterium]|nr:5'-methylthioadenosine/S-adenosylhomocysteine nucleosidase [Anaerolineae bacterium]
MSAVSPELSILLGLTAVETTYTVNGVDFVTGSLAGNDVVLFLSGVSMVNAAMNTQLLIDHFNVTHIIFSGIAGGVNPSYHIGDVVIAAQWGQYQEAYAARTLSDGALAAPDPAPFVPFGFMFPQTVSVRSDLIPTGEEKFWFAVDPQMLAIAGAVAPTVVLRTCTADNVCLTDQPVVHVGGSGVSGQTFVDNAEYREYVYSTFGADALDMETAAAAMVAYTNGVPFLAFRSLSDLAGGGPGANEIGTFFQLAADNSAAVTIAFLNVWAGQ